MIRARAVAHANRAANAAYRSAGGPREFTWLQCLGESEERGAGRLYDYIAKNDDATDAMLYRFATRTAPSAAPFDATPHCLQVALTIFVASVRALEPMVRLAITAESEARRHAAPRHGCVLRAVGSNGGGR